MNDHKKLLPCAHCGSEDVFLRRCEATNMQGEPCHAWYVMCRECGIQTEAYEEETYDSDDIVSAAHNAIDDAIACAVGVWNKRANGAVYISPTVNSLDLSAMGNDELVSLAKRITDTLTNKADDALAEIKKLMEEDEE